MAPAPARVAASPASTCSARCTRPPSIWSATAATAPPPGSRSTPRRVDALRDAFEAPRRARPDARGLLDAGRARRRDRLGRRARPRAGRGARAARAVRDGQPRRHLLVPGARFDRRRARWGSGHACCASRSSRAAAARAPSRSAATAASPVDADDARRRDLPARAQRLERRRRAAPACSGTRTPCAPDADRASLGEPGDYLGAVLASEPRPLPTCGRRRRADGDEQRHDARPPRREPAGGARATRSRAGEAACSRVVRRRAAPARRPGASEPAASR